MGKNQLGGHADTRTRRWADSRATERPPHHDWTKLGVTELNKAHKIQFK
jgi:hypothetical protein